MNTGFGGPASNYNMQSNMSQNYNQFPPQMANPNQYGSPPPQYMNQIPQVFLKKSNSFQGVPQGMPYGGQMQPPPYNPNAYANFDMGSAKQRREVSPILNNDLLMLSKL